MGNEAEDDGESSSRCLENTADSIEKIVKGIRVGARQKQLLSMNFFFRLQRFISSFNYPPHSIPHHPKITTICQIERGSFAIVVQLFAARFNRQTTHHFSDFPPSSKNFPTISANVSSFTSLRHSSPREYFSSSVIP
jgi:hypothetical protein